MVFHLRIHKVDRIPPKLQPMRLGSSLKIAILPRNVPASMHPRFSTSGSSVLSLIHQLARRPHPLLPTACRRWISPSAKLLPTQPRIHLLLAPMIITVRLQA